MYQASPPALTSQPLTPPPALEKPIAAFVLSLIGGIFILLWGLVIAGIGAQVQSVSFGVVGGAVLAIGAIESLMGLLILVFGVLLYVSPEHHTVYGVLVLVCSLVSLIGLGGLIIGFILALIGGILGIAHRTTPASPQVVYVQPQRVCVKCGRPVAPDTRFCPACGNPMV